MNRSPTTGSSATHARRGLSNTAKLCLLGSTVGVTLLLVAGVRQSSVHAAGGGSFEVASAQSAAQDLVDKAIVVVTSEDNNVPKYPSPSERLMVPTGSAAQAVTADRRTKLREVVEAGLDLEALSKGSSAESASPEELAELVSAFMDEMATSLAPEASAAILSAGGAEAGVVDSAYVSEDGLVVVEFQVENGFMDGTEFSLDMVQGSSGEWSVANARTAGLFGTQIFGFDLRDEFQQYLEDQ